MHTKHNLIILHLITSHLRYYTEVLYVSKHIAFVLDVFTVKL